MDMKKMLKGYALVMLSAILYGCMPLGAKFIYANGVNHLSLVLYRNLLLLPLLLVILKIKGEPLSITKKQAAHIAPVALMGLCVTPILLYASYNYISSGMATTLHFVYPAFVALGGAVFLGEKLRPSHILCVVLCTVGAGLFYSPDGSFDPLGSALAVLSAATMAAYVLLLGKLHLEGVSSTKYCFYNCLTASIVALIVCVVSGELTLPGNGLCWLACLAFSLFISYGAVNLFQQGSYIIGGQKASILSTFEPITSLVIGVWVFNESFSPMALLGAALIVAATALVALADLKTSK